MNRAIFLDRDGVINRELKKYTEMWDEFEFLPNVFEALKLLSKTDYKLVIVTNQGGIGAGLYTKEDLEEIHKKMLEEFSKYDIRIDTIKYCPHIDEDNCECRKPKPGMILEAAKEFDIDLSKSWMVGDKTKDIKAAENAKVGKTILVKTGFGGKEPGALEATQDFIAEDILDAANIILKS